MTSDAAKEFIKAMQSGSPQKKSQGVALDWDRLKELSTGKRGKFKYDFWFDDVTKITSNEGKVSLLQAYIDNQKEAVVEPEAIRMICEAGVDVNHKDKDGVNALFTATTRTDNIEVYRALIECGTDVNHICA